MLYEIVSTWKGAGCHVCHDLRLWVIQAHHVDPDTKLYTIARLVRDCYGLGTLHAELDKCVPLCANCHATYHHIERSNPAAAMHYLRME